jgi:tetratricopeptide (TPR) repeat protein
MAPGARVHFDRGLEHYRAGRFAEALRELRRAYDLDPRPEALYSLGQAARELGDCEAATGYFRAFLRTSPPPRQVEATRVQIARCERERIHAAERQPPPVVTVTKPEPPAPRRRPIFLTAAVLVDVISVQVGGEVGVGAALGRWAELRGSAVLGRAMGGRLALGLHLPRGGAWAVRPAFELRGALHGSGGDLAWGGGAWLGGTLEAGRGRLSTGVAAELFSGPASYYWYAILWTVGYAVDL